MNAKFKIHDKCLLKVKSLIGDFYTEVEIVRVSKQPQGFLKRQYQYGLYVQSTSEYLWSIPEEMLCTYASKDKLPVLT